LQIGTDTWEVGNYRDIELAYCVDEKLAGFRLNSGGVNVEMKRARKSDTRYKDFPEQMRAERQRRRRIEAENKKCSYILQLVRFPRASTAVVY